MRLWLECPAAGQLAILEGIAAASGRELRAFRAETEPQWFRSGGPRLVHRRSGVRLCLVPGGVFALGPDTGRRAVRLAPFLLAEEPLSVDDGRRLGVGEWRRTRFLPAGGSVLYLEPDEIARLTVELSPLRIPSDDEWEAAVRAGTKTSFFWGEDIPNAPPCLPHPLGLAMPGWWDELTAEGRVRGGAARVWPWHDDAGVRRLRVDVWRAFENENEPRGVGLRLALPLGACSG